MDSFSLGQRALAETLGTALLVLVGPGSVVATLVLAGDRTPAVTGADLLGISFAFGLIITALVYALGKVSGCHINPAVTFALAVTKRLPWREVPTYWASQVVGAVLGALAIWAVFAKSGIDLGMGQTSFNPAVTTWASAIWRVCGNSLIGRRASGSNLSRFCRSMKWAATTARTTRSVPSHWSRRRCTLRPDRLRVSRKKTSTRWSRNTISRNCARGRSSMIASAA